ncbi:Thiol:disulfide interchange protein DsbD precursor [compost metagenome]
MNNLLEAPFALLAGVLTIASPCVLPILPIILGTSIQRASKLRPLFIVAGFVLTFAALGMLLASVSQSVAIAHESLRLAGIVMLLLAGIAMLWRRPYEWLIAHLSGPLNRIGASGGNAGSGNLGGFVLGMSLGAIWTPCAGPVLASILVLVTQAQNLGWSASLLILYAVGAGIPMLLIAYGGQYMTTQVRAVAKYAERLQKIFGVLIVLTAIAIYFQYDVVLYAWISDFYPSLKGF